VTKLHPSGSSLLYSTLFGGNGNDNGLGITVDADGVAYITGYTQSDKNFPVTPNAYQTISRVDTTNAKDKDAFAAKLDHTGALSYVTYLGGNGIDEGRGIVVNANDEAYVVGFTQSSKFLISPDAYSASYGGVQDAFLIKLNSTGSSLLYGTFLGGNELDSGDAIAISDTGGVYLTGEAGSASFPTKPGSSFGGGENDSFVAKFQIDEIIAEPKFSISGTIVTQANGTPVAGITVSAGIRSTTTDSNGIYHLTDLDAGSYTVVPSKSKATFQPPSYAVNLSSDISGKDFLLQTTLFNVSGRVVDRGSGAGLAGVTIGDGTGGSATTDADGRYAMQLASGAYTFTPSRDKYIFDPPSLNVAVADDHEVPLIRGIFIPPPQPQYIALVRRDIPITTPTPTPTPEIKCDAYEPNNSRYTNPTQIDLNVSITAKICQQEGVSPPDPLYQDNYRVSVTQAKALQIQLALPQSLLVGRIALLVYDGTSNEALRNNIPSCYKDVVRSTPFTMSCAIPKAGAYVIRLYSDDGSFDNTQSYTLQVTQ
jgi:hypothetical protein